MKCMILLNMAHLFVMAFATLTFSQENICAGCGKAISENENYKIVLDKLYHHEHFLCSVCGKVITGTFFLSDDKFYHGSCYQDSVLPKCAVCGKPIQTEYITLDSKAYHPKCYSDSIAPRCSLCGGIIREQYIEDFWGNPYHSYHQTDQPQCWYCGRFISAELTGGGRRESNDQLICALCLEESVDDMQTARQIIQQVRKQLQHIGINTSDAELDLSLSSWDDLKQLTRAVSKNHTGFTESEVVYFDGEKVHEKYKIYILHNLPTYHFIATAAHELMHVWQHMYASGTNSLRIVEGSCNYAAYLVLNSDPDRKAQYMIESMMKDQSPLYGDGFRFIRKYVRDFGRDNWLLRLKTGLNITDN